MLNPGDVVILDFPGSTGNKRRPAVVLSTAVYQQHRPDVILGLLTTQVNKAIAPTDYILADWAEAGLRLPPAFRSYLVTADSCSLPATGTLSASDWAAVRACLSRALAIP